MDTVTEITGAPRELIQRLAQDIANPDNKPVAIHIGEGINHWFHATLHNRATYQAALFQGSPWTGPGFKGWVAEDPFDPVLDAAAPMTKEHAHSYALDE